MLRAHIILSTLVLGVVFKLWGDVGGSMGFYFHPKVITAQLWIYYVMEHINAAAIAAVILIRDDTPRWLLWMYFYILILDGAHFLLFFRDEGIGFNLAKVVIYGSGLVYASTRDT